MKEKVARIPVKENASFENVAADAKDVFGNLVSFFTEYGFWVLGAILVIGGLIFLWTKFNKRQKQIEKVWIYILFFLTKRQMLIPLVITLSKKDKILDEEIQEKLLNIRDECRNVSLKKSPRERMSLEKQVSEILFFYFSRLEKKKAIRSGSKFEKIVKDLEFIDAKLVQLQQVYNHEVDRWNKHVNFPVASLACRIIRFEPFQKFKN